MDNSPFPVAETISNRPTIRGLIHGLTYQTPVIGTIRIGSAEEKNGIKQPVADDHFTVWTRFRSDSGDWVEHQVTQQLTADKNNQVNDKLRRIPVRLIYDTPNLNMGEQYAAFKKDGRPVCVGNGAKARQAAMDGAVTEVACPGPSLCVFGLDKEHPCATLARALFHIEGQDASEGAFILRTGSYNSVNDMRVRMESLFAGFGKKLSGLPMWLTMRLKSTAQSLNRPFFYISLEPRFANFAEGIKEVKARGLAETEAGFDRAAYEAAMATLLANGSFTENPEDLSEFEDLLAGRSLPEKTSRQQLSPAIGPDLTTLVGQYKKDSANSGSAAIPASAVG